MTSRSIGKVLRVSLGFSVEGLGTRDEVMLKSLVHLLDHRTLHQWQHLPPGDCVALRVLEQWLVKTHGAMGSGL